MRLNLGCGKDIKPGYVNVDFAEPCDQSVDLSQLPWPWKDGSVDEILMLDFLEHFPYRDTERMLQECWRVLRPDGRLEVQVPDFEHCALAVLHIDTIVYQCNRCGQELDGHDVCPKCGQTKAAVQDAAIHRLYGGQNVKGNWHYTAFTREVLTRHLVGNGFKEICDLEHAHQQANWNFKLQALKGEIMWSDE